MASMNCSSQVEFSYLQDNGRLRRHAEANDRVPSGSDCNLEFCSDASQSQTVRIGNSITTGIATKTKRVDTDLRIRLELS